MNNNQNTQAGWTLTDFPGSRVNIRENLKNGNSIATFAAPYNGFEIGDEIEVSNPNKVLQLSNAKRE